MKASAGGTQIKTLVSEVSLSRSQDISQLLSYSVTHFGFRQTIWSEARIGRPSWHFASRGHTLWVRAMQRDLTWVAVFHTVICLVILQYHLGTRTACSTTLVRTSPLQTTREVGSLLSSKNAEQSNLIRNALKSLVQKLQMQSPHQMCRDSHETVQCCVIVKRLQTGAYRANARASCPSKMMLQVPEDTWGVCVLTYFGWLMMQNCYIVVSQ